MNAFIQQMERRHTSLGNCLYIKIRRHDDRPMSWDEIYQTYSIAYPDQWAAQFFPPTTELVNDANVYHLFVLDEEPTGVNIMRR